MMLRSAASTTYQALDPCSITIGSYVELRSEDSSGKPWLARIINTRCSDTLSGTIDEVECEWLWHPKESIRDFPLLGIDANTYGSREVFLGSGTCGESTSDWNPIDSIKWQVQVLPLDEYKTVAANGFQTRLPLPNNPSCVGPMVILESNRCWYFRQKVNVEARTVSPQLDCVIHRPNPAFHTWCQTSGTAVQAATPVDIPSDSTSPPPRTLMVPENPERIYFKCNTCERRFETRQGDCINPTALSDPKHFRLKPQINQSDVDFTCPMCELILRSSRSPEEVSSPPVKRARGVVFPQPHHESTTLFESSAPSDTDNQKTEETRREEKRKLTRYERFYDVFKKSIEEASFIESSTTTFLSQTTSPLKYYDPKVLCDEFLDQFESYTTEARLNAKMAHQKLHEIFQNLKRENNTDLRRRIVTGELQLHDLVRSDAKDLAPESLKRRREAEARKYFEQQVLLQTDVSSQKILRKTHKGLEAVDEDNNLPRSPLVSRSPSPERVQNSDDIKTSRLTESLLLPTKDNERNRTFLDYQTTNIETMVSEMSIKQLLESNRELRQQRGELEASLVDLPFPLAGEWESVQNMGTSFSQEQKSQLISPLNLPAIPNKEKTYDLLNSKLSQVTKAKEKLLAELKRYALPPAPGALIHTGASYL